MKKDRITISVPIILSINQWSLCNLKKCWLDNQIYMSQLITSVFSYKLLFEIKKIDRRLIKTLNLEFMLMFFDSVYPTRPFDTVTEYTIYSLSHRWKDYSNSLLYLLLLFIVCYFILWLAKYDWKMPCILLAETEYSLEFALFQSSDIEIQTAVIWW